MKFTEALNPLHVYRKRDRIVPRLKGLGRRAGLPMDADDRRLRARRNRHQGRRAFVIGNGPSLRVEDLDVLHRHGEITFAANKIYLAFGRTDWRPTYYLVIDELALTDPRFYEQDFGPSHLLVTGEIARRLDADRLRAREITPYREIKRLDWVDEESPQRPGFSANALHGIVWGSTVTYSAIQFAAYMGIQDVYLLGVDANYNPIRGITSGGVVLEADGTERNHFHPDYHPAGSLTYPGEVGRHVKAYARALEYGPARKGSFRIANATRGGKLEVFPRVDFDTLFPSSEPNGHTP